MPGTELRRDSFNSRGAALNSILGVASESVNAAVEVLLLPSFILAFFVAELTPSYPTIGLVPAIATGFWTLGRLPAHLLSGSRRRQKPWVFAATLVRVAAVAILAVATSRTDPTTLSQAARPLLLTFFLCLIVFSLAGGFGSLPSADLLRSSIPSDAWPAFLRQRTTWSTALCLLAALVVARVLGTGALNFPGSYGQLFLVATLFLFAVAMFTGALREPRNSPQVSPGTSLSVRSLRQPLYDFRYRRFLLFRILLSAAAAIDPFLILYAVIRLGAPVVAIAGFVLAGVLGWVLSGPVWFWIDRHSGPRAVLQGATVVRLIAPAVALAMPPLVATEVLRERLPDSGVLTSIYGAVFFAIGASLAAQSRANYEYLAALAPKPALAPYVGMTNAVLAVVAFAPVLGGLLIQRFSFEALFGTTAALGLAAVFASSWLADTPSRSRKRGLADYSRAAAMKAFVSGRA